jgi:hypothetical protein
MSERKLKVIGVGGFARSGKDTFVNVAKKILTQNGYSAHRIAFADALKDEVQSMLRNHRFTASVFIDDTEVKKIMRSLLVWWGGQRRIESEDGLYWVDIVHRQLEQVQRLAETMDVADVAVDKIVYLVSDVRFPNEAKWVHEAWNGWFVHVKKYRLVDDFKVNWKDGIPNTTAKTVEKIESGCKVFDQAPNEEEAKQDPIIQELADDRLELENVIEREARKGNKITAADLPDNMYLQEEIRLCLAKIPFLTIQKS